jgi:uncharacterized protein DUF6894
VRYFFVIRKGRIERSDEDGTVLPDDEAACAYAHRIIRQLKACGGYDRDDWTMVVFAEGAREVCRVNFAAVSLQNGGGGFDR